MSIKKKILAHWWNSGGAEDAGLTILKEGILYANFAELAEADTETITTNLSAYGTLGARLSPINSPIVTNVLVNGNTTKTLTDSSNKCMSLGESFATIFNTDFEVWKAISGVDGRQASSFQLIGARQLAADSNRQFLVFVNSTGLLQINYGYSGTRFIWQSSAATLPDGAFGVTVFRIGLDFTNDTLIVQKDGVDVAGSFTASDISALDPSLFDTSVNPYDGSLNNEGTASSNDSAIYHHDTAIKGISTTDEANLIWDYLTTNKYA